MDTTLIFIGVFIFLALSCLVWFVLVNSRQNKFIASDGSVFKSQSELEQYHNLLIKIKPLFSDDEQFSNSQLNLGLDKAFLAKLRSDGFKDIKTLLQYRNQIKTLSSLLES